MALEERQTWVSMSSPHLLSYVTLGEVLSYLAGLQFLHS